MPLCYLVKLHQKWCLCFPFLFTSSVLQSFFSFSASYLFGTQQQLTHLPVKSSIPFLSGRCPFFRALHLGTQISLYPASSLFGTQQHLIHFPVNSSSLLLWTNHVSQGLLLCNVLILSYLGSLWFGTQPYYLLNSYMHLYYLWSISMVEAATIQNTLFYMWSIFIAKDRRFAEECSTRL